MCIFLLLFFCVCVRRWMTSLCMSLHCHICCFQGNPVGKLRSAERYTAWRRETCGAQPVDGKKPVRDSPTNPVAFPWLWETSSSSLGVTAEVDIFFPRRDEGKVLNAASSGPAGGKACLVSFHFPKTMRISKQNTKRKKQNNFTQIRRLFKTESFSLTAK